MFEVGARQEFLSVEQVDDGIGAIGTAADDFVYIYKIVAVFQLDGNFLFPCVFDIEKLFRRS